MLLLTVSGCHEEPVGARGKASLSVLPGPHEADQDYISQARFEEQTPECLKSFRYSNGEEAGLFGIIESVGGGVGLLDYDVDGRLDVMLAGGGGFGSEDAVCSADSGLFRNLGNWQYSSVATPAGVANTPYYSHGVVAADANNDGFCDVLVTGYGGLQYYINLGDGTFAEQSVPAGLTDDQWSVSAAWGDLDADGLLDLYVANYVNWTPAWNPECRGNEHREVCPPHQFEGLGDTLYMNNGDGTFRDATAELKLEPAGKGLGVLMADIDVDGDTDLYVCNDAVPNFVYRNDGSGGLANMGVLSGAALSDLGLADSSMGVDAGDYNGDGLPDIIIGNFETEGFGLYHNEGDCRFRHASQPTNVYRAGGMVVAWGASFLDFDRDGDEDVIAANGHVKRHPLNAPVMQPPVLLENLDGQRFVNVTSQAGDYMAGSHMGRGLAIGDMDRDGDTDVVISHTNGPPVMLANETENNHGWLGIRLIGTGSNRDAIGALLRVTTAEGRVLHGQVKGGGSYASTSSRIKLFGLHDASGVAELQIRWPSGTEQTIANPAINEVLTVVEHESATPAERIH